MKTSTRSFLGMLRLVSLTTKCFASGRFISCDEWMLGVNFRQASYRIDCSLLVSEFRFRTKIELPIVTPVD
jgi:hypothetical protein